MERGPLALFGAILAVGLGPALWLGAQLGAVDLAPGQRPAPVDEQFPGADMDFGGAGAGEMPDGEPLGTATGTPRTSAVSPAAVRPSLVATSESLAVRPVPPAPPPPPRSSPPTAPLPADPSGSPSASHSPAPSAEPGGSVSVSAGADPGGGPEEGEPSGSPSSG